MPVKFAESLTKGPTSSEVCVQNGEGAKCRLILRFMKPGTAFERFVQGVVKSPVHVDIVLDEAGTLNKRFSYSSFMNDNFSVCLISNDSALSKRYTNLAIDISKQDLDRCTNYVKQWVDKVKYNYGDAMLAMPVMPKKGEVVTTMMPDVDGDKPDSIRKLFCSQAAFILLKYCIQDAEARNHINASLSSMNSRVTSPNDLYNLVLSCSKQVEGSYFVEH